MRGSGSGVSSEGLVVDSKETGFGISMSMPLVRNSMVSVLLSLLKLLLGYGGWVVIGGPLRAGDEVREDEICVMVGGVLGWVVEVLKSC